MNAKELQATLEAVQRPTATIYHNGSPLTTGLVTFDPAANTIDIDTPFVEDEAVPDNIEVIEVPDNQEVLDFNAPVEVVTSGPEDNISNFTL